MAENITPDHPAYYAEVLRRTTRVANRPPPDEKSCPNLPGIVDDRVRALLDIIALISLCKRGNVSAATACLDQGEGGVNTRIYVAFNKHDESAERCAEHLQGIFAMLSQIPYDPPTNGSSMLIAANFKDDLDRISRIIHNYSFDIFAYRVNKRKDFLSDIQRYIEQDREEFSQGNRSKLMVFLKQVDMIIKTVAKSDTKQLPTSKIQMLREIYIYWKHHNILLEDPFTDNKRTLLDHVDEWLAQKHHIGFQLRRWATKIMSFVVSANRLFTLTQSRRLHHLLRGNFSVKVLPEGATIPYHLNLSLGIKRKALVAALTGTRYLSEDWNDVHESFVEELLEKGEPSEQDRKSTMHAELTMIVAMAEGRVKNVKPYIGVSKLSCIMCSHYISAFNQVMDYQITTRGSHGKAYPGWFWPTLSGVDGQLCEIFLKAIKQELRRDFERHAEKLGRLRSNSDSSVGSNFPDVEGDPSESSIEALYNE